MPSRPISRLLIAMRAHGLIDGLLIWLARIVQRRVGYRAAWPLWSLSNRYENWRFQRMYDEAVKRRGL